MTVKELIDKAIEKNVVIKCLGDQSWDYLDYLLLIVKNLPNLSNHFKLNTEQKNYIYEHKDAGPYALPLEYNTVCLYVNADLNDAILGVYNE